MLTLLSLSSGDQVAEEPDAEAQEDCHAEACAPVRSTRPLMPVEIVGHANTLNAWLGRLEVDAPTEGANYLTAGAVGPTVLHVVRAVKRRVISTGLGRGRQD